MTKRESIAATKVAAIEKRAGPLTDAIEDHTNSLPSLYAERLSLWKECVKLGMKHREIAVLFRVETVTVSGALAKAAKR